MKSIILWDQEGYPPELLAFNGETNFAIIYYACTLKPYAVASKLGDKHSNEWVLVARFEEYDDCLRYYQSMVLQHLENTIPVEELFKNLKRTDLDNVFSCKNPYDERLWSALIRYRHPLIQECIEKIQALYDVKISGEDK